MEESTENDPDDGAAPAADPAAAGGAALLTAGLVAVVGTALVGVDGPVARGGLAATAVGLAAVLYGLGRPGSRPAGAAVKAGVGLAVLSVALAPLEVGVAVPLPGGAWAIPYAGGLALLTVGGVWLPAVAVRRRAGRGDDADEGADDGPTATVGRTPDGDWTWRLTATDGRDLAEAARTYDSAAAAREAVRRLRGAVDGELSTVTEPGGGGVGGRDDGDDGERGPERDVGPGRAGVDRLDAGDDERTGDLLDARETAVFEVRERRGGWRWRLRYGDDTEVAAAGGILPSEEAAREAVARVRTAAPDAGALTYDPGAFEVYPREDGAWSWRLREDDDGVVARSSATFETREAAMSAIRRVKDRVDADPAVAATDDGYRWELPVEGGGSEAARGEATERAAREAFARVRATVPEAGVLVLDPAGFAVSERAGGSWGWRLRHSGGGVLAESPDHANRDRAVEGLRTVQRVAPHADVAAVDDETARAIDRALSDAAEARSMAERLPVVRDPDEAEGRDDSGGDAGDGDGDGDGDDREDGAGGADGGADRRPETGFEVFRDEGWCWRLRHGDRELGTAIGFPDEAAAAEDARRIAAAVAAATVVTPTAVEVHPGTDDGWAWRVVDGAGAVVARSAEGFDRSESARHSARSAVEELAAGRDPEVYRDDGWRWRLRGDDGPLAVAGRGFETTDGAADDYRGLVERVRDRDPPVVEVESAIETVEDADGGWCLCLRDVEGRTVAGFGDFDGAEAARRTAEAVTEALGGREDPVESPDRSAGADGGED